MSKLKLILSIGAALSLAPAFAQINSPASSDSQSATSSSPVAYVYVSTASGGSSQIVAYSAAPNGALSPVPGSPFQQKVGAIAANGQYLAAISSEDIDTFSIAQDGSLTFANSINYAQYNNPGGSPCGEANYVFFDRTNATLYTQENGGTPSCSNNLIASFAIDPGSGSLTYLGDAVDGAFPGVYNPAYFVRNNRFAYSAGNSACMYYEIYGFQRQSNGLLNNFTAQYNLPAPPPGVSGYIADLLATDSTNHLAVVEQPASPPDCDPGPLQLASYTVDPSGNLNTTNTYKDMPSTPIINAGTLEMSPSGKLVALAGAQGLQVFHFNGASPITHYTGLLTTESILQIFWDNNNHLYAITDAGNELLVFTVTPTTYSMAPGSPYAVSGPLYLAVQPLSH